MRIEILSAAEDDLEEGHPCTCKISPRQINSDGLLQSTVTILAALASHFGKRTMQVSASLKQLAKSRHLSINKLVEELTTSVLSAHDAEVRFRALALKSNPKNALTLLDKLDNNQK